MSSVNFYQDVSVKDALHRLELLADLYPPESVTVPVDSLVPGRILAEDIEAEDDIPRVRTSLVDGIATMANHDGTKRRIVGLSTASTPYCAPLLPGEGVRITIGGAVPNGADTVVPCDDDGSSEETDGEEHIEVRCQLRKGENIREIGSEAKKGEVLLKDGSRIDSLAIGLLKALQLEQIEIYRKPRVCVMSSGKSEARENLIALFQAQGFKAIDAGSSESFSETSRMPERIRLAADFSCVIVVTGNLETVKTTAENLNLHLIFDGIASEPGNFAFANGSIDRNPVVLCMLPEEPNAAWIGANLLISPLLRAMEGRLARSALRFQAQSSVSIGALVGQRFLCARTETSNGRFLTTPMEFQNSMGVNSIMEVPKSTTLESGDYVSVFLVESHPAP